MEREGLGGDKVPGRGEPQEKGPIGFPEVEVVLSPELQAAISQIVPSSDPLDAADFSPVGYINTLFPDVTLDDRLNKLKRKIASIDREIVGTVRKQSATGDKGRQELEIAKKNIEELFGKIRDIKGKAERSEAMVTDITRDIKELDYTKKHLETAISTLRRVSTLLSGTRQLREFVAAQEYRPAHDLLQVCLEIVDRNSLLSPVDLPSSLQAMNHLLEGFARFKSVPKMKQIESEINSVKSDMKTQIYKLFSNFGIDQEDEDTMRDACLAVDALGGAARRDFIMWLCDQQLRDYKTLYGEKAGLDQRFGWLTSHLNSVEALYARIFPSHWSMLEMMAAEFCVLTRLNFTQILRRDAEGVDVKTLLFALERTIDFERRLMDRFERGREDDEDENDDDLAEEPLDPTSREAVMYRLQRYAKKNLGKNKEKPVGPSTAKLEAEIEKLEPAAQGRSAPTIHGLVAELSDADLAQLYKALSATTPNNVFCDYYRLPELALNTYLSGRDRRQPNVRKAIQTYLLEASTTPAEQRRFKNIVSAAFDPYLDLYIEQEDKNLQELLQTWDSEGKLVLDSSSDMVYSFEKARKRCQALTTGETYVELHRLFKKYLKSYAATLEHKVGTVKTDSLGDGELKMLCLIINTGEYCNKNVAGVARSLERTVQAQGREHNLDLDPVIDAFQAVIQASMTALVAGLKARLNPALVEMTRLLWAQWTAVGDQSEYVNDIDAVISSTSEVRRFLVANTNFNWFCDLFAGEVASALLKNIYACKRISEVGAQHMLMDLTAVKGMLERMPTREGEKPPARFAKEFFKPEALLKVILSPQETTVDTYKALIRNGTQEDFAKILEIKGLKGVLQFDGPGAQRSQSSFDLDTGAVKDGAKKMWASTAQLFVSSKPKDHSAENISKGFLSTLLEKKPSDGKEKK